MNQNQSSSVILMKVESWKLKDIVTLKQRISSYDAISTYRNSEYNKWDSSGRMGYHSLGDWGGIYI